MKKEREREGVEGGRGSGVDGGGGEGWWTWPE